MELFQEDGVLWNQGSPEYFKTEKNELVPYDEWKKKQKKKNNRKSDL